MTTDDRDTDAMMRRVLSLALPTDEPPIGIEVSAVVRRGRRRYRARRMIPIAAAAAVAALLVAVPLSTGPGDPGQDDLPIGETTSAPSSTVDSGVRFRVPDGHRRDEAADALADAGVKRLPAEHVVADFGTVSDEAGTGGRYGFGFHILWRDGGRYGYLTMLHRAKGDFPGSVYNLPDEPCTTPETRLPEYHCVKLDAPGDEVAYSYEIDADGKVRGVVWDTKDPRGGPDIRVTGAFRIPDQGAWTPFTALDDAPLLTEIPFSTRQLADVIGLTR